MRGWACTFACDDMLSFPLRSTSWEFGIACYFWFITFSTIGLGDFGPAHENQIATVVLITLGLALVSQALNAIQVCTDGTAMHELSLRVPATTGPDRVSRDDRCAQIRTIH